MLDILELTFIRYPGGTFVPRGSYLNPRTFVIYHLYEESQLPPDNIYLRVDPDPEQSRTKIANMINSLLGSSYKAADFREAERGKPLETTPTKMRKNRKMERKYPSERKAAL